MSLTSKETLFLEADGHGDLLHGARGKALD
jgi:hypothetical protein